MAGRGFEPRKPLPIDSHKHKSIGRLFLSTKIERNQGALPLSYPAICLDTKFTDIVFILQVISP